jgi:anti-sigma regulatory factor (Ser/Thr protein kinase)
MTCLQHEAVFYDGVEEFVTAALPFAREAVAAGEPLIVVEPSAQLAALREAMGADAAGAEFHEAADWYRSPGKAFKGYLDWVTAGLERAPRVRTIGEPIWPTDWDAAVAEYAHYESVYNVIAEEASVWSICPYDVGALPAEIIDHARATHPYVRTRAGVEPSESFVDPHAYCSHLASRLHPPTARVRRFPISPDLGALRAAVAAEAQKAGVTAPRAAELVVALHEVAMNALMHGAGDASAQTWSDEVAFVCEVTDRGLGLSETVAGYEPPGEDGEHGRGLWLARQICDLVEIRSDGGATQVRLHVKRGS